MIADSCDMYKTLTMIVAMLGARYLYDELAAAHDRVAALEAELAQERARYAALFAEPVEDSPRFW